MKINLDKLRAMGWHVSLSQDSNDGNVVEVFPPPMPETDWRKLREVIGKNLQGDALAMDLVVQQTMVSMQKAAMLSVLEIEG